MELPRVLSKVSVVLPGLSFLLLVIFAASNMGGVRAQTPMQITGIPEKGLVLVGANDPLFPSMANAILNGRDDLLYNTFQPYSVVLWNKTGKTVVEYCLRWEFTKPDGKRVAWDMSYGDTMGLLDGSTPKAGASVGKLNAVIRPGEWMVVTPKSHLGRNSPITPVGRAAIGAYMADLQSHVGMLRTSSDLTVGLDGVFFDDGTFVGPDQSGFFDRFKAEVQANQDVANQVLSGIAKGQGVESIANQLKTSVSPPDALLQNKGSADWYQFFKNREVSAFLRARSTYGDDNAIALARRNRFEHPPDLRKAVM